MIEQLQHFKLNFEMANLVGTVVLLITLIFTRIVAIKSLRRWKFPTNEIRRRWIVTAKNITTFFFLLGLVFVWGDELRNLAFSLVAIAAAVAVALKELIMCFTGGIFKASTKLFEIGDRISVASYRGEVTDQSILATSLFEIGPGEKTNQFTGKTIKIPNSVFLSNSVVVEPAGNHFALHSFFIPMEKTKAWKKVSDFILEEADRACEPFLKSADHYIQRLSQRQGVDSPSVEPKVTYSLPSKDTIEYYIRIPVPFDKKAKIEKSIIESSLERIYSLPEYSELRVTSD